MLESPIKNYPGAKGGNGVYQRIINKIPRAELIIVPFLGSGQIFRRLDHEASRVEGNDIDTKVYNKWINQLGLPKSPFQKIHNRSYKDFLIELPDSKITSNRFFYFDPPYLLETRNGNKYYGQNEWTEEDHYKFLVRLIQLNLKGYKFLLSHPICDMYKNSLSKFCSIEEFEYMSRNGMKKDCLWFNYDPTKYPLNTYKYLGEDSTNRQRLKRQQSNIINKLKSMDLHTRDRTLRLIKQTF